MDKAKTLSTLKRGATNELNAFFAKPTEVFRALRDIAKDGNSALRSILNELGVKPSKIGFATFGRYCSSINGDAILVKEVKQKNIVGTSYVICDNKPAAYIDILIILLKEKRQRDSDIFKNQKFAERQKAKETKATERREKALTKMVAELVKCGLPAEIARANAESILRIA